MLVAIDVLLVSSGTPGAAWDLHEEPWKTLANPCLFVVGSATRGAAGRDAGQVDRESPRFPEIPYKTLQKRAFLQPRATWGDRGLQRNVLRVLRQKPRRSVLQLGKNPQICCITAHKPDPSPCYMRQIQCIPCATVRTLRTLQKHWENKRILHWHHFVGGRFL